MTSCSTTSPPCYLNDTLADPAFEERTSTERQEERARVCCSRLSLNRKTDARMLGKLTHWLSMKLELEDKEDDSLRLRFDALVRFLGWALLVVVGSIEC